MIDPDYYLFADLSITEIEGPDEFYYDWEAEEALDYYDAWKWYSNYIEEVNTYTEEEAAADNLADSLIESENIQDLVGW